MSGNSQKNTKAEAKVEKKAQETAQNAPERVETLNTVEVQRPEPKAKQSASDAALAQALLDGSSPEPNNVNAGAGGRMTIDEALHTYFAPTDIVRVKNPFDFDTGWVYSDPKDVVIEQPTPETRRVYGIGRDYQKTRILHKGESLVLQGWEAYIGLTRFYKQWVQVNYQAERLSGAMNNPLVFKGFMDKVYCGIYDPNAGNKSVSSSDAARAALENDLGFADGGNA